MRAALRRLSTLVARGIGRGIAAGCDESERGGVFARVEGTVGPERHDRAADLRRMDARTSEESGLVTDQKRPLGGDAGYRRREDCSSSAARS